MVIFGFGLDGRSHVELQRAEAAEAAQSTVLVGFQVAAAEICPAW